MTLPPFERLTLEQRRAVVLVEKRDTPLVSMRALRVRGGSLGDATGKEGTAALARGAAAEGCGQSGCRYIRRGSRGRSAASSRRLPRPRRPRARCGLPRTRHRPDARARRRHAAATAAWTRRNSTRRATLAMQSIAAAKDADPRALIGDYGDAWLFRGHPYGRPDEGGEKSLESSVAGGLRRTTRSRAAATG